MTISVVKICVKCGKDVAQEKRVKDPQGRYYCAPCFDAASKTPVAPPEPTQEQVAAGIDGELDLAPLPVEVKSPTRTTTPLVKKHLVGGGPPCPCCGKEIFAGGKICVGCGIQVPSGRPVITALARDENMLYANAEQIIRWLSWVISLGLYPIASEAYATKKPIVTWIFAALTTIVSVWFFIAVRSDDADAAIVRLMLWPGDEFRWYQLITNVFLHDPSSVGRLIMHLGGNMLFLLIFGTRVNALVGNLKMALLYPLLGILASAAELQFSNHEIIRPALGASGAIMGLAGMYLIFFPVHRVHMAFWWRLGWLGSARIKIWAMRGFWVLGIYLAFDVLGTIMQSKDGVAHWAHLGGFIAGAVIALVMLITRMQDARHSDLLSVTLGKAAWPLIGKPMPLMRGEVVG